VATPPRRVAARVRMVWVFIGLEILRVFTPAVCPMKMMRR
jgi:hypothetical protein